MVRGKKVERVRVMGNILNIYKPEGKSHGSITIKDKTGDIQARAFKGALSQFKGLKEGDTVDVVGKPREHDRVRYINVEAVALLVKHGTPSTLDHFDSYDWFRMRQLELEKEKLGIRKKNQGEGA
jgi:RecJ-like exonuclease